MLLCISLCAYVMSYGMCWCWIGDVGAIVCGVYMGVSCLSCIFNPLTCVCQLYDMYVNGCVHYYVNMHCTHASMILLCRCMHNVDVCCIYGVVCRLHIQHTLSGQHMIVFVLLGCVHHVYTYHDKCQQIITNCTHNTNHQQTRHLPQTCNNIATHVHQMCNTVTTHLQHTLSPISQHCITSNKPNTTQHMQHTHITNTTFTTYT